MRGKHNREKKKAIGFSQKAFVFNMSGKFLTLRRTHTAPMGALLWDLPGGIVTWGEKPLSAIRREIKEETGLTVKNLTPVDVKTHVSTRGEYWITVIYTAYVKSGKFSVSWEHDLYAWVTKTEFLKLKTNEKLQSAAQGLI